VKDYRASIEKLRKDAAEAALIRDLATDQAKRAMYDNLHKHFNRLADEVERAMKSSAAEWSTMLEGRAIWYLIPALLISGAAAVGVSYWVAET
jgi:hypothetical protein